MSLASILLTLEEHRRIRSDTISADTSSRHLASAGKWSREASTRLDRFQKNLNRSAAPCRRRMVRLSPAELRPIFGIPA
jgi:hypothetical protein